MGKISGDKRSIGIYYNTVAFDFKILGEHLTWCSIQILVELSSRDLLNLISSCITPDSMKNFLIANIEQTKEELNEILDKKDAFLVFCRIILDTARGDRGWHASNRRHHPELYDKEGNYYTNPFFNEESAKKNAETTKAQKRIMELESKKYFIEELGKEMTYTEIAETEHLDDILMFLPDNASEEVKELIELKKTLE